MAEYIDRAAVEKFIEDGLNNPDKTKRFGHDAIEIIAEVHYMPAADVAPVVHGRWDDSLDGITPYCTVCGNSHRLMTRTPNYCPNCGAKMDGGADNGQS